MPRFILSLRYLKMKKPSQVKNYVKYVATRPNAEKFEVNQSQREATEHQKRWIEKELKANKDLRESCEQEYEVQFAPHGGHWCVCQRPPGGAQRPPSLRYFDRLNNNNVMLRCPLHNSVG